MDSGGGGNEVETEEVEASRAVLFPWFAEALGIIVFYLTTRYVLILPYTGTLLFFDICFVLFCVVGRHFYIDSSCNCRYHVHTRHIHGCRVCNIN